MNDENILAITNALLNITTKHVEPFSITLNDATRHISSPYMSLSTLINEKITINRSSQDVSIEIFKPVLH